MSTWPDLAALELLVAVADHGSLGAAARAVGMAQPNASRSMSRLERHLAVPLIHRSSRGSALTSEGIVVVEWSRQVLAAATQLTDGVQTLSTSGTRSLRVAASQTVAEHLLPLWLAAFRLEQTSVSVSVEVHNTAEVVQQLTDGAIDLGFVEGPRAPAGVHALTVARDELVLVVGPEHPWRRRRSPVSAEELRSTPLVTREAGSGTRVALDTALGSPAISVLQVPSNAAVRVAVQAGAAPAVLSRLAAGDAIEAGHLFEVPLADIHPRRALRAIWTGPRQLRGPAAELVSISRRR